MYFSISKDKRSFIHPFISKVSDLQSHQIIHTDEKLYTCKVRGNGYAQATDIVKLRRICPSENLSHVQCND